jgi:hypothetical protein
VQTEQDAPDSNTEPAARGVSELDVMVVPLFPFVFAVLSEKLCVFENSLAAPKDIPLLTQLTVSEPVDGAVPDK